MTTTLSTDRTFAVNTRNARGTGVDAQLREWEERGADQEIILRLAPAPALECPTWCEQAAGHGWKDYDQHGTHTEGSPSRLTRIHGRTVLESERAEVTLYRWDALDLEGDGGEYVWVTSHVDVEIGEVSADDEDQRVGFRASRRVTPAPSDQSRRSAPITRQRWSGRWSPVWVQRRGPIVTNHADGAPWSRVPRRDRQFAVTLCDH